MRENPEKPELEDIEPAHKQRLGLPRSFAFVAAWFFSIEAAYRKLLEHLVRQTKKRKQQRRQERREPPEEPQKASSAPGLEFPETPKRSFQPGAGEVVGQAQKLAWSHLSFPPNTLSKQATEQLSVESFSRVHTYAPPAPCITEERVQSQAFFSQLRQGQFPGVLQQSPDMRPSDCTSPSTLRRSPSNTEAIPTAIPSILSHSLTDPSLWVLTSREHRQASHSPGVLFGTKAIALGRSEKKNRAFAQNTLFPEVSLEPSVQGIPTNPETFFISAPSSLRHQVTTQTHTAKKEALHSIVDTSWHGLGSVLRRTRKRKLLLKTEGGATQAPEASNLMSGAFSNIERVKTQQKRLLPKDFLDFVVTTRPEVLLALRTADLHDSTARIYPRRVSGADLSVHRSVSSTWARSRFSPVSFKGTPPKRSRPGLSNASPTTHKPQQRTGAVWSLPPITQSPVQAPEPLTQPDAEAFVLPTASADLPGVRRRSPLQEAQRTALQTLASYLIQRGNTPELRELLRNHLQNVVELGDVQELAQKTRKALWKEFKTRNVSKLPGLPKTLPGGLPEDSSEQIPDLGGLRLLEASFWRSWTRGALGTAAEEGLLGKIHPNQVAHMDDSTLLAVGAELSDETVFSIADLQKQKQGSRLEREDRQIRHLSDTQAVEHLKTTLQVLLEEGVIQDQAGRRLQEIHPLEQLRMLRETLRGEKAPELRERVYKAYAAVVLTSQQNVHSEASQHLQYQREFLLEMAKTGRLSVSMEDIQKMPSEQLQDVYIQSLSRLPTHQASQHLQYQREFLLEMAKTGRLSVSMEDIQKMPSEQLQDVYIQSLSRLPTHQASQHLQQVGEIREASKLPEKEPDQETLESLSAKEIQKSASLHYKESIRRRQTTLRIPPLRDPAKDVLSSLSRRKMKEAQKLRPQELAKAEAFARATLETTLESLLKQTVEEKVSESGRWGILNWQEKVVKSAQARPSAHKSILESALVGQQQPQSREARRSLQSEATAPAFDSPVLENLRRLRDRPDMPITEDIPVLSSASNVPLETLQAPDNADMQEFSRRLAQVERVLKRIFAK